MPTFNRLNHKTAWPVVIACSIACTSLFAASAATVGTSGVGSANVATADPQLPVPDTTPCVVNLLQGERFGEQGNNKRMDATPHRFAYHPPRDCKGPYAKIVLDMNFAVDAGVQYDRTASLWVSGVNLYFGTTQEPTKQTAQSWHVQRDLTDYSSLFRSPGSGVALVNNFVDDTHNSVVHVDAKLLFYPANGTFRTPTVANLVIPLGQPANVPVNVQTGTDEVAREIMFPRSTDRVYIDLFTQSQFKDEFWYLCLPEKYVPQTSAFAMRRGYIGAPKQPRTCDGGNFREAEVLIDGVPAGLAPVSPWIYTGGIDPLLWRPVPGVQTLNFMPYRVDLTPFAGVLADGRTHKVSVKVLGANHYFAVVANLLVFKDAGGKQTHGAVIRNSLRDAVTAPKVTGTLAGTGAVVNGDVRTAAAHRYVIEGYVDGSSGRVKTRVTGNLTFMNTQTFTSVSSDAHRKVTNLAISAQESTVRDVENAEPVQLTRTTRYWVSVDKLEHQTANLGKNSNIHLRQRFDVTNVRWSAGHLVGRNDMTNAVTSSNELEITPNPEGGFGSFANKNQASSQYFVYADSAGGCYRAEVWTLSGKVAKNERTNCGTKPMRWSSRPDGSPGLP